MVNLRTLTFLSLFLSYAYSQTAPSISNISPSSVPAGTTFTLTVNGANFCAPPTCVVVLDLINDLSTSYVSASQLTATVPGSLITSPGSHDIRVARNYPPRVLSAAATLTVTTALPNIVLSNNSVTLNAVQGGSTVSQSVNVSSSGSALSITAAKADGPAWLSVAPTSGTTPLSLSISGNPTGLNAGTYSGSVSVSSAGAGNSPQYISVTFNVTAPRPNLSVSPSSLSFTAQAGTSAPQSQNVSITSTGAALSYSVGTSGGTWLSASPSSGTTPGTTTVTVNAVGLGAGTYYGTVSVSSAGAGNSPQTVSVTLTVTSAAPNLSLAPTSLLFTAPQGSATQSQTVSVSSTGAPLNFTVAAPGETWVSVSPASGTTPATLTVTVNPGSMNTGLYNATLTVSSAGAGNSPQTVSITFNVTPPAPTLTVSPSTLNFSATQGGTRPASQSLSVSSTGGALGFTVQFATASGGNWLNVTPTSGTTPAALTVAVNQAGLGNGTYTGTITLIPRAESSPSRTVNVTMVVGDVARLTVAPGALNFTHRSGETGPPPQSISIFSTPTATPFTASLTGGTWASLNLAGGLTPGAVTVRVDPTGLGAGTYTAQLRITGQNTNPPSTTVTITLTVEAQRPAQVDVLPGEITYSAVRGGSPLQRQFAVLNTGGGTLQFTAERSGGTWLSLATTQGSATPTQPGYVSYTVSLAGQAAGVYSADVIVRDRNSAQTATHRVTLVVSPDSQVMLLSQTALEFTALVQETGRPEVPRAAAQAFGVLNIGQGSMPWTVEISTLSGGSTWLRATPARGTAVAGSATVEQVSVSVDQQGLAPGRYYGRVRVLATGATNSPQTVSVAFNVVTATENLPPALAPSGLILIGEKGGANPPAKDAFLFTRNGQTPTYTSTAATEDGANWLIRTPASGQVPAQGTGVTAVQANLAGLEPGVRRGLVRFAFADASVRTLSVTLVVVAAGGGGGFATPDQPRFGIPGCRPNTLLATFTTLDQNFSVSVGERVSLKARVRDNCDDPMTSGTVVVRISGETLPLSHEGDGIWANTWVPRQASAEARLSLTAIFSQGTVFLAGQANLSGSVGAGGGGSGDARPRGVVNPASFLGAGRITPGSWAAIFGDELASTSAVSGGPRYPYELAGTRVTLGGMPMALHFVHPLQVNALVPWGLRSNAVQQLLVERGETLSLGLDATVTDLVPAIYTTSRTGSGQGAILVANTGLLAAPTGAGARPVRRGEYLEIYASGLGPVDNTPAEGVPPGANSRVRTPVIVTVGGQPAQVLFAGLAPGFFGLYQVNVQVPQNAPVGNDVPVVISVGGLNSNTVTIAVQ